METTKTNYPKMEVYELILTHKTYETNTDIEEPMHVLFLTSAPCPFSKDDIFERLTVRMREYLKDDK